MEALVSPCVLLPMIQLIIYRYAYVYTPIKPPITPIHHYLLSTPHNGIVDGGQAYPSYLNYKHVMGLTVRLLLALIIASTVVAFEKIDDHDQLMHFHQENSQYPIVHIYHNRHFSQARQFQDFLEVLEETEYRCKDYARFVLTDCEKYEEGETFACDDMRRSKDNRMIFGYFPVDNFVNYAGKRMQNPPGNRHLNHPSDVFAVSEIEAFIDQMIPNFFEELTSLEQYREWLKPKYSPKLLFASREDEVPLVIRKLGVHFFLHFDLAYLSDLTDTVTKQLNLTSFPRLIVLKYNYKEKLYEMTEWEGDDFTSRDYLPLKDFLVPFALQQPRNDLLFHKMRAQPDRGVVTVSDSADLQSALDRAGGWVIVSAVRGDPLQLKMLRERYGRFFEYVHYEAGNETQSIQLYDSEKQHLYDLPVGDIQFKAVGKDDFIQTMGAWIKKGFVLIGVRERYGYFCAIAQTSLFRGLTQCLIVKEDDYAAVSAALKMQFQLGFACYQTDEDVKEKIVGRSFKSNDYQQVFQSIEYLTRLKSKEIVDDFMDKPIKSIPKNIPLAQLCASPNKKCALLLTTPGKTDRTAYDYLKEIAVNFINEYLFFEVELGCNPQLEEAAKKSSLLVYHPKNSQYVALKAKLSKTTFEKFLRANLSDNKKLPFHAFGNEKIQVYKCPPKESKQEEESL